MAFRTSGVLLHITSLPSPFGIGDLGPGAYRFVDQLVAAHQRRWQILPIHPARRSPYSAYSAFGGNPLLISPELLRQDDLLTEQELNDLPRHEEGKLDFDTVTHEKNTMLCRVSDRFRRALPNAEYKSFCREHAFWLDNYATFAALAQQRRTRKWDHWPPGLRDRQPKALAAMKEKLADHIEEIKIVQFFFFRQWNALRSYCHERDLHIIGDIPFYLVHDCAAVWGHRDLFQVDKTGKPTALAGFPPDQFWNMPIYHWENMKKDGYRWWLTRIGHTLNLFDWLRIDHFLGLFSYWEIPGTAKTAEKGEWKTGPGEDMLGHLVNHHPTAALLVEDLGNMTQEALASMARYRLPGLRILMDGFKDNVGANHHAPHNYPRHTYAYTGTHDCPTVRGWFDGVEQDVRNNFFRYVGREVPPDQAPWEMIRLAMMSAADTTIFPMQDVLGLGGEARMNTPGTTTGNWTWRLLPDQFTPEAIGKLGDMTAFYGRI